MPTRVTVAPVSRLSSWVLLFCICLPLLVGLDSSSIWNANEAFYVQTPKEMLERGDWIVPYFNNQPRLNKPPLSYWIVGFFYQLVGASVLGERLAMALMACLAPILVYAIARELEQGSLALVSAGIFGTCFRFLVLSRRLMIDVLLLVTVLATIYAFVLWDRRERPLYLRLMAVGLGLAFLAKGPVAVLPVLLALIYLLTTGQLGRLAKVPWLSAGCLFILVVSPWFVLLGFRAGWSAVADFFFLENVGRFTNVDFGPRRNALYYWTVFVVDFFPWSLAFLGLIVHRLRQWHPPDRTQIFLAVWLVGWIGFFSLSFNKQEYYIVPAYPAAALLIGDELRKGLTIRWPFRLAAVLLLPAAVLLTWLSQQLFSPSLLNWAPLLPALVFSVSLWLNRWRAAVLSLSLFFLTGFALYLTPLEEYRPVRKFADSIRSRIDADRSSVTVGYYKLTAPSLAYYVGPPVAELYEAEEVATAIRSSERTLLVMSCEDVDGLEADLGIQVHILERRPRFSTRLKQWWSSSPRDLAASALRSRPACLVSNQPDG